jgi:hypothetical protein
MGTLIFGLLVFWAGFCIGFLVRSWLFSRMRKASGTIVVGTDRFGEKTVYSLVLDEYPDELRFKKQVVFNIEAPESDRN